MCLLLCLFFLPLLWGRAGLDGVIKGNVALDAFFFMSSLFESRGAVSLDYAALL